jgi:hypothetical protein
MLLVVSPVADLNDEDSRESPLWTDLHLPDLPTGSLARLSDHNIEILASDQDLPPAPAIEQTMRLQLQRLQRKIVRFAPRFSALVIAGRYTMIDRSH